jgi:two-component system, cell cycle sensor histidine kinase and response regulator CckA
MTRDEGPPRACPARTYPACRASMHGATERMQLMIEAPGTEPGGGAVSAARFLLRKLAPGDTKPTIAGLFLTSMVIVTIAASLAMGIFLIVYQADNFRRELKTLRAQNLEYQKTLLASEVERTRDYISYQMSTTDERLKRDIRSRTEEACAVAEKICAAYGATRSRGELERLVTDVLRAIRFDDGRGYYFAADMNGTNRLMGDDPEIEGRNLFDYRDTEGRPVLQDMIRIARAHGEGFYRYSWSHPGETGQGYTKISYVKLFKPFGWIIGTGAYVQDIEKTMRAEVLDRIARIKFGKDGYIFAGTYDGVSLIEPAKGRNMLEVTDLNGVKIVQELISAARAGGGFVQYVMPRLDGRRDAPKLSYALGVDRWRWYIGAGMYIDDMEALVAGRRASLERSILWHVLESAALFACFLAVTLLVSSRARRKLSGSLDVFKRFFDQAATGAARIDPRELGFRELETLAGAANIMAEMRLAAERRQLSSEERYRVIVANLSDALVIHTIDRTILDVNENACRMYGYSRGQLVGANLSLVCREGSPGEEDALMRGLLEAGSMVFEAAGLGEDGTIIPVEVSARVVSGEGRGVIQAFVRDITARREAEKSLRESEALLRTLMDNMNAGVIIVDAATHVIERVNPATADLVGSAAEEIRGRRCHGFLCPAEEYACPITDLGQDVDRSDRVLLRSDGTAIPVIKSVRRIRLNGRDKLVETFIDITERKRAEGERAILEEQVRQTQKLESLGILAGGIAHDFNNILTSVLGNAELALMDLPPRTEAGECISRIETAARRAAELCRQMLAYSGRASFAREPVDLRLLVSEMADLLSSSISRKGILRLHIGEELPPVHADPSQLRQVIMNLIINASEAIGETRGEITVSAKAVHCTAADLGQTELRDELPPGPYIRLEVSDTGCGMDAATRARIFEPFFTTKFKGRGLGLAAVLGIVRSHKGALRVGSAPGSGTTFTILLPAGEAGGAPGRDAKDGAGSTGSWARTVLLVDDEPSLRELGSRMLEKLGCTVLTACDGREAVDVYARRRGEIDLVVLDLTMPNMDGAEALEELRALSPGVRVVLASGHSEQDIAGRFSDKGIAGVLPKPYALARLRQLLSEVLGPAAPGSMHP